MVWQMPYFPEEVIKMKKAVEVVYLTHVEGANLNAAGTEGVISILKKVTDIDGREYIRISGQSLKYHIRQIWRERGLPVSEVKARGEGREEKVIVSSGDPVKYIDDDLFGYMLAGVRGEKDRKRTAVVRTNGMISLFPYKGDRDFGVRYDPTDPMGKHNIYEVEIASNILRGNIFVELDRLGKFDAIELGKEDGYELSVEEKEKRLHELFDALFHYFGGAHLSNYFTKTYPEMAIITILNRKFPILGDKIRMENEMEKGKYKLKIDTIREVLSTFDECIERVMIGGFESVIANWNELKKIVEVNKKVEVVSMKELIEKVKGEKFFG